MSLAYQPLLPASAEIESTPPPATNGFIKVWLGSAWELKPVKYWTGAAWVQKPILYWNGASWVQGNQT